MIRVKRYVIYLIAHAYYLAGMKHAKQFHKCCEKQLFWKGKYEDTLN